MQPAFLPGALAVLIGALIAGLDRTPQLIAAQPTIAPSLARAVDNQCVTAAVDAWAETSGLQVPAWTCRNATVAFAVSQAQAEATCFHTCQPQNEVRPSPWHIRRCHHHLHHVLPVAAGVLARDPQLSGPPQGVHRGT
ncbi:hypothetical protein HaLaN_00124 [Haematococcus lacustris]|uniref:Uncharacterized protein n=1 Tax=Haematococcus lacustris TaxID=44745 RepID=A0A699YEW8_HAELA|nr:hypothetical protein HaLaN_00124 [Haematococcus lacustris]